MPLRVLGINAIGTRHSGAATVLLSLIDDLLDLTPKNRIIVFASHHSQRLFKFPENDRLAVRDAPRKVGNPVVRFLWLNSCFFGWVKREGCDIIYNANNLAGRVPVPQILFLQQSLYFSTEALQYYMTPEVALRDRCRLLFERILGRFFYDLSIRNSQGIIVQTEVMKEYIQKRFCLKGKKLSVVPPSVSAISRSVQRTQAIEDMRDGRLRHWIYVGNNSPYKNLSILRKTAVLSIEMGEKWLFHLIGGSRPPSWMNQCTRFHPYLNREQLQEAYGLASALIMPSWSETVGLPMIEAILSGTPVVAADLPYAREICGPCALYFDPRSHEDLFAKLKRIAASRTDLPLNCRDVIEERFSRKNNLMVWKELNDIVLAQGKSTSLR